MRRFLICLVVTASALALPSVFSVAVAAGSPPFYGETYAKAADAIKGRNATPEISTVIGSQVPIDDCIVTNAYPSITLNSTGRAAHSRTWFFDLNCNQPVAAPGKPGNSVATPEGRKAKTNEARIVSWNKTPEKCDGAGDYCRTTCQIYGGCSDELLKYLASLP